MLRLNRNSLTKQVADWEALGIQLPKFNDDLISQNTKENPEWIHFGAGNIFRGFVANAHQKLLNQQKATTGIIAADTFDYEIIEKIYKPYDNLTLLVQMRASGEFEKTVVGSIVESLTTEPGRASYLNRLVEIFEKPSLQMVSFTITEKGYSLWDPSGEFLGIVQKDIDNGLDSPIHAMSIITALTYRRYLKGQFPVTLVSMDNCSHNGDKLKLAVMTMAKEWVMKGFVEQGFIQYLEDETKISFPLSMIDKITPRPSDKVKEELKRQGIAGMDIVVTSKNTYIAPFVNAEISEYLVIEDKFANGRPPLEEAGIIFTDRDTVNRVETMKVTTCLNPLHTALAVSGCLLGYTLIADEMKDPTLRRFVEKVGYEEGLKVVVDPGIINPKEFIDEVVNERFSNPFIPDTPQRIATDTSQKVGIRYGETIKSYMRRADLQSSDLVAIPLAIATWCRYLLGINDEGQPFTISPDPLADMLKEILKEIHFNSKIANIKPILSNDKIFGVNLYEAGVGEKIEIMFVEMLAGKGAVRSTLEKYLG